MLHPTRTSSRVFALALATFVTLAVTDEGASHAQGAGGVRMFLSFPDIEGESTVKGFERQVDLDAVSVGVSTPAAADKVRATGKISATELSITKRADTTSPLFYERATSGKVAPAVSITFLRGTQVAFTYKLTNVSVASFHEHAATSGEVVDQLSLRYEALAIEATKTGKGAGVTKHGFDFAKNRAL